MHVVYIITLDNQHDSGKIYKIRDRVAFWRKAGLQVSIWVLVRDHEYQIQGLSGCEGVQIFNEWPYPLPMANKWAWVKKAERFLRQAISVQRMKKELATLHPDLVYYTQHIWLPGLARLLRQHLSIMEINTIDTEEVKFTPIFRRWIYRAGRRQLLRAVKGFVCVTPEIARAFRKYNKPCCVVTNGIDLKRIPLKQPHPARKPQLIFVGSASIPSQGIDLVWQMAERLPQYFFHLVCPDIAPGRRKNILSHGQLNDAQLAKLYPQIDVGIGTLGLYRKHMHQACPLKVREYIAAGLPLIIAYDDTDLPPEDPHVFKLPNRPFHWDTELLSQITRFVEENHLRRLPYRIRMRVDIARKEEIRLQFFQEMLQANSSHSAECSITPTQTTAEAPVGATEPNRFDLTAQT
ncbi:MAG: glycosyltransferase [Thermoflavifilum sp.]|nr:glycosyltransferase [Thermoflavifilum sp.]